MELSLPVTLGVVVLCFVDEGSLGLFHGRGEGRQAQKRKTERLHHVFWLASYRRGG